MAVLGSTGDTGEYTGGLTREVCINAGTSTAYVTGEMSKSIAVVSYKDTDAPTIESELVLEE